MRAVNGYQDIVLFQNRECSIETGIELSRQGHEVHQRRRGKSKKTSGEHQDTEAGSTRESANERGDQQHTCADALKPAT